METANQSLASNSARLDELQAEQLKNSRGILQAQKTAERYIVKRQTLTNRKEECNKSIRDLGVLPGEAYQKYTKETQPEKVSIQIGPRLPRAMLTVIRTQLVKKLHKVQEHLKGYSHVNKKAFEQYTTFTKQRDGLLDRRDELDVSGESIQDLIETLDTRKDEAIERTFKQVSKYFSETFEKLVPAGRGKLKMLKRLDGEVSAQMAEQRTIDLIQPSSQRSNWKRNLRRCERGSTATPVFLSRCVRPHQECEICFVCFR